ncbi:MAG: type II secretion system protein [Patescibacteria group bacterium]|nr:type II secretion system protein [Patescibacteria group bacterium]
MKTRKNNTQRGFTLLELLIAIAILGLLASLVSAPIMASRQRSRDAKRIENFRVIRDALEMYSNDNGVYPPSPCGYNCNGYYYSCATPGANAWSNFASYLAPYIDDVPVDPINTTSTPPWSAAEGYCYAYGNVANPAVGAVPTGGIEHTYDLTARLETRDHPESCGEKDYRYYFNDGHWCTAFGGAYSNQILEGSPH